MTERFDDDDYVANLLKQDAKRATKTYELVGIDAFNPRRANSGAPKLNTNFLRHIIRQTDSHNAALLAKEAEESNARLKLMDREKERARRKGVIRQRKKAEGRLTPLRDDDDDDRPVPTEREIGRREHSNEQRSRQRRRYRDSSEEARNRRHRDSSDEARRRTRRHLDSDEDQPTRKRKRARSPHDKEHRNRNREEDSLHSLRAREHSGRHRSRRSYSRSPSRSRSRCRTRSDRHGRKHRIRDQSHSNDRRSKESDATRVRAHAKQKVRTTSRQSVSPAADSDPLEAIVGPLPPSAQPAIRSRGRGAHKANSMGIESRFSFTYNPAVDVRPDSDVEDEWGDALEALKDRQRWQQQGADRLKAAGFSEEQVRKWERGEEQTEEDVVWTRKGQAREWDRGKVVDEDGDVELRADFGRLK